LLAKFSSVKTRNAGSLSRKKERERARVSERSGEDSIYQIHH
jgi:hypothetical protein